MSLSLAFGLVVVTVATPSKKTIPPKVSDGTSNVDPSWYCDGSAYCDGGGTCCPIVAGSGFMCAPAGERFSTCSMDASTSCDESVPIVCGDSCCGSSDVCRDGSCFVRSPANSLNATIPGAASVHPRMQYAKRVAPAGNALGWFPTNWGDGMLSTVEKQLHEDFLAVQASAWRSTANKPGNCWVIGFPSDLSQCPASTPWADGCTGSSATITQDGEYTFYNNNPTFNPTNYDAVDWCNDDHNKTETAVHDYSKTETRTASFSLSSTLKITAGMSSTTEAKVDIGIASGSETFQMSASVETDFSSTKTQTQSVSKQWTVSTTVQVGPRSHVYSSCFLQTGTFSSPFDGRVKMNSPVVWACSSPEDTPDNYIFPTDSNYWTSQGIEDIMESNYGFAKEDLQNVFGQKIGGTFTGIAGQKVQCSTHTVYLQDGESCPPRSSKLSVFV